MRQIENSPPNGVVYHEFECSKCGAIARNTYCEPHRTDMLDRKLCWTCNFWFDRREELLVNHSKMTIIEGNIYTPGNRTEGSFRGMAGRRFDIEYIEPSTHAGKRITTFDLWSGSTIPEDMRKEFPDTAKFLNGAERCDLGQNKEITTCWNPSQSQAELYPLPKDVGI